MDKDTAVIELRKHDTLEIKPGQKYDVYHSLSEQQANEIADLIEQQEKYAKLGQLAVESKSITEWYNCDGKYTKDCMRYLCDRYDFCQKLAELVQP